MDDQLRELVTRVEAATQRRRECSAAMSACPCVAPCTWCRAMRVVANGELIAALEELESAEARLPEQADGTPA